MNLANCWGTLALGVGICVFPACADKVDSVFGTELTFSLRKNNSVMLSRLQDTGDGASDLRVGIIADSHQDYRDLERTVARLNDLELDFVIHLGDFTDFGLSAEYAAFVELLEKLRHPVFVLVGNHDAIGSGRRLYEVVFGDYNISFEYKNRRFVFFNSNSLEFEDDPGYDPAWLEQELRVGGVPTYLFQHVNLNNPLFFTSDDHQFFANELEESPDLRLSVHGHLHTSGQSRVGGTPQLSIPPVEGVRYVILEIREDSDRLLECHADTCLVVFESR